LYAGAKDRLIMSTGIPGTYSNVLLLKAMQVFNVSVHLPYSFE